jgi:hypothetical protein
MAHWKPDTVFSPRTTAQSRTLTLAVNISPDRLNLPVYLLGRKEFLDSCKLIRGQ